MGRSFRFLLNFAWANLGAIFGFAAIVIAGCYVTGVPNNAENGNLFETYYAMFPTMILLILFLYAFALCTNNLNLGLSMGARRTDFFWALQGIMVFYSLVCWALQLFMSAFPALANWEVRERWALLELFGGRVWIFPLVCFVLMVLGCLSGLVVVKSKILGGILVTVSVIIMVVMTVIMLLYTDDYVIATVSNTEWGWFWDALPKVMAAVLAAAVVGGELLIRRTIRRYIVR